MIQTVTTPIDSDEAAMAALDDDALLRRFVEANDRTALETIFRRHVDAAYATALRICRNAEDARDAVQNAFLKVMNGAAMYRGGSDKGVRVWITRIVIGTCKDRIRSEIRRRKWEDLASGEQETTCLPEDPSADEETRALAGAVFAELNGLPERYRMPILLHHCQGLSLKETAAALSLSENTLHAQLKRGLERLRHAVAGRGVSATLASVSAVLPLLPGGTTPDSLLASVSAIARGVHAFAPDPKTTGSPIPATGKWLAAAALVSGAVLGVWMLTGKPSAPAVPSAPLLCHWSFESPELPPEFKVLSGTLRHRPNEGTKRDGALLASNAVIRIDIPIANWPFLVSYTAAVDGYMPDSPGAWIESKWLPAKSMGILFGCRQFALETLKPGGGRGQWHTHRDYYCGTYISRWREDGFQDLKLVSMEPEGRVTLCLSPKILLDELTIRAVSPAEVPDASLYLRAIEKIPPDKRKGDVPIPDLRPGRGAISHEKMVFMRFFTNCTAGNEGQTVE